MADPRFELGEERAKAFRSFLVEQYVNQRTAYGVNPPMLSGEEKVEFIRWNILAALRELTEMLNLVDGWKPWQQQRDSAGEFKDRNEFVEEGVDVLHFVANLLLTAGCFDHELSEVWAEKQRVNAARQAGGQYGGVGKEWDAEHRDPVLSAFNDPRRALRTTS